MSSTHAPRYKIQIISSCGRGEQFNDVIFCICCRAPIIKNASYWVVKVNVSALWAQQMLYDVSKHDRTHVTLQISEVKYEGEKENLNESVVIYERVHVCINIANAKGNYQIDMSNQNAEIILVLTDPIFYDLSVKHYFNRRFGGKTALDIIDEFENDLVKNYNDNFYKNRVNIDGFKTNHKYEQLFLISDNDLHITDMLLYNKKALLTPSFYFLDDFCMDENNNKSIACHFINLYDINSSEFKKFNISKYSDTSFQTILLNETPLQDIFKKITNGCTHWNIDNPRGTDKIVTSDPIALFKPIVTSISDGGYDINVERKSKIVKTELSYQQTGVKQKVNYVYSPDTSDLAKKRIDNFSEFICLKVKQLVVTQTIDCYCDWLQFGRVYNLDLTAERINNYLHTPVLICNIFYKDGNHFTTKHIAKSVMLEYYRPFDNLCSSCSSFQGTYCTMHNEPKKETNYCANHSANYS